MPKMFIRVGNAIKPKRELRRNAPQPSLGFYDWVVDLWQI